ncbi:hypothetical protein RsoM2USA_83 [Ralstonia phage RsoM2USA]|nr:hypothetical protein RsoM2USA_83 [Ralstonia phage RsoM2USA]
MVNTFYHKIGLPLKLQHHTCILFFFLQFLTNRTHDTQPHVVLLISQFFSFQLHEFVKLFVGPLSNDSHCVRI